MPFVRKSLIRTSGNGGLSCLLTSAECVFMAVIEEVGWVGIGERFAQFCLAETVAYGGYSWMMWAGIALEWKTEFVFVPKGGREGGLTTDTEQLYKLMYRHYRYSPRTCCSVRGVYRDNFVLMHDNAWFHASRITGQFLEEVRIQIMVCPALSHHLRHESKHLWDELKQRVVKGVGRSSLRRY